MLHPEENQPPDMFRKLGMIVFFMVIAFHAINMVIEQQIAGEMLVGPTYQVLDMWLAWPCCLCMSHLEMLKL